MAVGFSNTNKPLNPRGQDASPKGYNRAALYSGKALDFDGNNDNVDLDGFTMSGNIATISFYLKADDWDANSFIFAAGTPEIVLGSTTGGNNLSFYDSSSWQTFGAISDTTSANFFSIVFNGTSAIAYMNGVKFGNTLTITPINISSVTGVKLMSKYTGDAFFFNGQLSGFKIFNTALTAAQVADLYNNPEKVVPTGVDNTALKLWLPMMEGAGTTAYDGSGNGNHGTISGATYVNGIGAPVAQTAVMDWNKGQNVINKSESFLTTYYSNQNITVTADQITAPDGDNNGYKFVASNANTFHLCNHSATVSAGVYTQSIFAKAGEYEHIYLVLRTDNGAKRYGVKFDLSDGTFVDDISYGSPTNTSYAISDAGNGWYRCSVTSTHTSGSIIAVSGPSDGGSLADINNVFQGDGTSGIYVWGLQAEIATSVGAYIPNPSDTRITSDVLLPQGLTTGRDITGVNLFENVRKQGALNLDGNSWAEVHDNESLDMTDAITLEAWVYAGSGTDNGVLGKWYYTANKRSCIIYQAGTNSFRFYTSSNGTNDTYAAVTTSSGWVHLVGIDDGTNLKFYVNGSEEASVASLGSIYASDQDLKIGNMVTSSQSFPNQIAQPRIYNRALTASEVLRNYNSGKNTYTND
jgi:hypothetical protein